MEGEKPLYTPGKRRNMNPRKIPSSSFEFDYKPINSR